MNRNRSICDVILEHFQKRNSSVAYCFIEQKNSSEITYGKFSQATLAIAKTLQEAQLQYQPVILLYQTGLDFLTAFWGCLFSNTIPIVLPFESYNKNWNFIQSVYENAKAKAILTTRHNWIEHQEMFSKYTQAGAQLLYTNEIDPNLSKLWKQPKIIPDDIALIQYSSGSTTKPKGIVVTHTNLLREEELIQKYFNHNETTVFGSFVPHYHDLGLIGMLIQPLYLGISCFFMTPDLFVRKPYRWLEMISTFKVTTSGGPNFAYQYLVNQAIPEGFQADLSSWKVAFNVADMVFYKTLKEFAHKFAPYGFRFNSFISGYGMAETTLMVALTPWQSGKPNILFCDTELLSKNKIQCSEEEKNSTPFVSCGPPVGGHRIQIVDPETFQNYKDDQIGEIWVQGDCVTKEYLNDPVKTKEIYQAHLKGDTEKNWLRTGDLGFLHQGELYIVGRLKDTLIINGQKYYPYEIEEEIRQTYQSESLRTSCLIQLSDYKESVEKIVLVQEIKSHENVNLQQLNQGIEQLIYKRLKNRIQNIYWVPASTLPKTTSGKLKRFLIKSMLRENTLPCISVYEHKKPIAS